MDESPGFAISPYRARPNWTTASQRRQGRENHAAALRGTDYLEPSGGKLAAVSTGHVCRVEDALSSPTSVAGAGGECTGRGRLPRCRWWSAASTSIASIMRLQEELAELLPLSETERGGLDLRHDGFLVMTDSLRVELLRRTLELHHGDSDDPGSDERSRIVGRGSRGSSAAGPSYAAGHRLLLSCGAPTCSTRRSTGKLTIRHRRRGLHVWRDPPESRGCSKPAARHPHCSARRGIPLPTTASTRF